MGGRRDLPVGFGARLSLGTKGQHGSVVVEEKRWRVVGQGMGGVGGVSAMMWLHAKGQQLLHLFLDAMGIVCLLVSFLACSSPLC
jgi:hypothetical protein